MTKQEATEYLEGALENWYRFCETHPKLTEAVEVLLEAVKEETDD